MDKKLINADDFGISNDVNLAIKECFLNKYIDRTTIMVNMENFDQAVDIARKYNFFNRVGLHINLIEGVPLTESIKSTGFCTDGRFNGSFLKKTLNRFYLNKNDSKALKIELSAQMEKYIATGFTLKHIDSHEHSHTNPSVARILLPLAKKYEFNSVRLSRNIPNKSIRGMKAIYKSLFNIRISRFNHRGIGEMTDVKAFGSLEDYENAIKNGEKYLKVELMVHPILVNGKIVDAINPVGIGEWLDFWK